MYRGGASGGESTHLWSISLHAVSTVHALHYDLCGSNVAAAAE